MIRNIQEYWKELPKKRYKLICKKFNISNATAKKYISMTEDEIKALDKQKEYKTTSNRAGNDFVNIIYKMMVDGHDDLTIFQYLRKLGFTNPSRTIQNYIKIISSENFPDRKTLFGLGYCKMVYPNDVIVIKRTDLLKTILTIDPKKKKDEKIIQNLDLIKEKYPIVGWISDVFLEFHSILMGSEPDKIDSFIEKYENTEISPFCNGIKKDIAPVKNAISMDVSSGFVEGNNNKFKLIKRIVYGRSNLVNLSSKCKLAFMVKTPDFSLKDLL